MDWLEDAKRILEEQERFNAEKPTRLHVKSPDDLPTSYVGFKSISFSSQYTGPSIESLLPNILDQACNVEKLHIFGQKLSWKTICSLDLSLIQEFYFSLDGDVTSEKLIAPCLKKLCIFGTADRTPIELMVHPMPHIDFSGTGVLEILELRHFQQVDPVDFQNVSTLKKLLITESNITNLDWLQTATYSLNTLILDGVIEDCSGVVYQSNLKELALYHSYLIDISPIERLKTLKKLDLRYGNITSEGHLRSMALEKLVITQVDSDYVCLQERVKDLVRWAVLRYQRKSREFDKMRMQYLVRLEFDNSLKQIDENFEYLGISISKEEYRELFVEEALNYCPFLKEGEVYGNHH